VVGLKPQLMYQDYFQYALDQAQIEYKITTLSDKNGTIVKYY
jgi:hypothetical protein